jgi:hypothetical protein
MSSKRTLIGTAGSVLALLAFAVGPHTAVRAASDGLGASDVVAFIGSTGAAGGLTCTPGDPTDSPSDPVTEAVEGVVNNAALAALQCPAAGGNGVPVVGGRGTYTFRAPLFTLPNGQTTNAALCVGVSAPDDTDSIGDLNEAGLCSFTTFGSYENIVCGTGEAWSTGATPVAGFDGGLTVDSYEITFVSGIGLVTGSADAGTEGVVGAVQLLPAIPGAGGICVTSFNVLGVVFALDAVGPVTAPDPL